MRMSQLFGTTLRENPADAEMPSHQLLVRAGMIRSLAAGIYSSLPLGWRVLRKIETVIRQEMEALIGNLRFPDLPRNRRMRHPEKNRPIHHQG